MVQTRSICCRLRRHCCWWSKSLPEPGW